MKRDTAIEVFGSIADLAKVSGYSRQAIYLWPDELPQATVDRLMGVAARSGKYRAFKRAMEG